MNFYGGTGEASHTKFAVQMAKQYYNMLMMEKMSKYMNSGVKNNLELLDDLVISEDKDAMNSCKGKYTFTMTSNGTVTEFRCGSSTYEKTQQLLGDVRKSSRDYKWKLTGPMVF